MSKNLFFSRSYLNVPTVEDTTQKLYCFSNDFTFQCNLWNTACFLYSIFIFYLEIQMLVPRCDIFVLSEESYSKYSNVLKIDFSFGSNNSSWKWINRMVSVDKCQQDVCKTSVSVKIKM